MGTAIFQILSAGILHFNCLNFGLTAALPSTTMLLFTSNQTSLHRPMTETEASLLGSLACLGALISTPLAGLLMDRMGRKRCSVISATIGVLSWCMLILGNRVEMALISSFTSGVAGSIFLIVPVYVSEFAEDSIRGTLTSGAVVFNGLGILLSFLLGGFLKYGTMVYIGMSMSAVGVVTLTILKESPICLLKKGLEEEAVKSLAFYRNSDPDSKIVLQELDKLRRALAPESEKSSPEEEKLTSETKDEEPAKRLTTWQFFKKSRSTRRAFYVSISLMTVAIFQGMVVVQVYAKQLFTEAVPEEVLSATWCCVLLAVVGVISGLLAAYLTDVTGRRTLMINASIAAGFCCLALGTQIHLQWGPYWLTAVFIYLFCAAFALGGGTVPFLLIAELFLPEVKSVISMIVMEWTWSCSFIALFIFNPLVSAIGLGPVFYFFTGVCFFSAAFSYFFLPETKGLTVNAIQLLFVPKKDMVA